MIGNPVHEDARGQVYTFEIKGVTYGLSVNNKGALRGGDYHPILQYNLILQGQMKIIQRIDGKDISSIAGPNELVAIQPRIPHLLESITETVMIEWWDGKPQSQTFEPYRSQVKANLQKLGEELK